MYMYVYVYLYTALCMAVHVSLRIVQYATSTEDPEDTGTVQACARASESREL